VIDPVREHVSVGAVTLKENRIRQGNVQASDGAPAAHAEPGHLR
jgi:hypothetical protein